jgi:hypothetical protein
MSRRWLAAATFVALVLACASPTLPLPPPEAPSVEVVDSMHVLLTAGCGGAEPNALISITDDTHMDPSVDYSIEGNPASECGAWQMKVFALTGDTLSITQTYGNAVSPATLVCPGDPGNICPQQ